MAIEITRHTPAQLSTARADSHGQTNRNEPTAAQKQTGQSQTTDTVTLSDTASQLHKLGTMIATQPVVDLARVDNVRQALNAGHYEFNAARVAEKMLRFENARQLTELNQR